MFLQLFLDKCFIAFTWFSFFPFSRLALLSLNFAVLQSFEDYDQDVVAYANHYHLDGIISNDMNLTLLAYGRITISQV